MTDLIDWRIVVSVIVALGLWEAVRFVIAVGGGIAGLALWDIMKALRFRFRRKRLRDKEVTGGH